ncbi:carboxypeptidase regulatory-like domain-containing protein [Granulicella sp. dw_53]|uniref:TonB-dependent receptor n=1 Tax=Granulicella sp. dw_53 TaxID=2719792 RepID=UPI001BD29AB0|nr:carboxypeptidase regulatory-like domain-containing protein [Granulicella sp. dw_53]
MKFPGLLLATMLFCGGLLPGFAQTSKGILSGVVRDVTGATIEHAQVEVLNQGTGETRTLTTSSEGVYRADSIGEGVYSIHIESAGFSSVNVKGIRVNPSVTTTYDAVLHVGATSNVVDVQSAGNNINTENGQLSGTIGRQELDTLPNFPLNPASLLTTLPGVQQLTVSLGFGATGGNGTVQLAVNGARPRTNYFMVDSQDVNDVSIGGEAFQPILPDMYSSVTGLLNSSSAEFGRSGGAVINQVTQSGTNKFHGTVHEIYSGSGLDALDGQTRRLKPLAPGTPNPKARYDQHQYGFTAGGPLWKNKLFAFGGATFVRLYGNSPGIAPVELPDANGYARLTAIGGPQATLLQGYLNNGSYLDPANFRAIPNVARGVNTPLESIAVSSRPGCVGGCSITTASFQRNATPLQSPDTQWMYRIDFIPRTSDTFYVRYLHDRNTYTPYFGLNPTTLPGFDTQVGGPSELGTGSWIHIFTPNLLNEFRASETRINSQFFATAETNANPIAKLNNITFLGTGIPTLGVSQSIPQGRSEELYQFQDTVGYTYRRQSIRTGADVGRLLETDLVPQRALGALSFAAGGGLSSLDNFLNNRLGTSGSATKTFGPTRVDPHIWKIAGFIQDDIKLSSDITVNVGIRYDYLTQPLNSLSFPGVDVNNPFQAINTYVPVKADKNNIAPRIGLAYAPHSGIFSDGKTVIHAGFGIFYDPFFTSILADAAASSPVAPTGTLTSVAVGGLTNASGLLATITPAFTANSSVQSSASNLVNPQTYQYNLGVERELPAALKLTVNYVGSRGLKLFSNRQLNYFINGARINPTRGAINIRDNRASSNYNAGQLQLDRSFRHGLYFRVAYTYSKNLDNSSEVSTLFTAPTSYSANLAGNGLYQDYGPSAYDRRHLASFAYSYTPAGFHSDNLALNLIYSAFTRHITVSGQTTLQSGPYSSFNLSGKDTNGDGSTTNDRPVLSNPNAPLTSVAVDGSYIGGVTGTYYDQAAYNASPASAPVRTPINSGAAHFIIPNSTNGPALLPREIGRNSFENPGLATWDVALEKAVPTDFAHLEGSRLIFRAEAQDIANHDNVTAFSVSSSAMNIGQVGQSTFLNTSNARDAYYYRHIRLWAKFVF